MFFFFAAFMGVVSAAGLAIVFTKVISDRRLFNSASGSKR